MTRGEFEEAVRGEISATITAFENTLSQAGLKIFDISAVFLAGGSTRVPCVLEAVQKMIAQSPGTQLVGGENVDEVVALGAALYSSVKSSGEHLNDNQREAVKQLSVQDISTYYFGTLAVVRNEHTGEEELQNVTIINKGEKIPCSVTEDDFATRYKDQQVIHCVVTRSGAPETDPEFVTRIWEGKMELPAGRTAGQGIRITFSFDESGMMRCSFADVDSGRVKEIDLNEVMDKKTSRVDVED